MEEKIILVDKNDKEIGICEKMKAHEEALLHRAFSIYIFNDKDELLLQQRAFSKYHSGGLWSNTCCSHPRENESLEHAIHRRLKEEMGFDCDLEEIKEFIYKVELDHDLTEYEYLHVYKGIYNKDVNINKEEVENYKWEKLEQVKKDIEKHKDNYTYWFKETINKIF